LDFADEVLKPEFLSFRFKLEQSAQLFQTIFKQCQQEIKAAEVQQKSKVIRFQIPFIIVVAKVGCKFM
jgi:hypothetical protein